MTFLTSESSPGTQESSLERHTETSLLEKRQKITEKLLQSPYDLILYLERASIHTALGYPDLAIGDSYRALLLCDECTTNGGFEYHDQALTALKSHCTDGKFPEILPSQIKDNQFVVEVADILSSFLESSDDKEDRSNSSFGSSCQNHVILRATYLGTLQCYRNLSISLLSCQCLKSAYNFCSRGLGLVANDIELLRIKVSIESSAKTRRVDGVEKIEINELPDQGWARREVYPWNQHEPDRFSHDALDFLNRQLACIAVKCEVKATNLITLKKPLDIVAGTKDKKLHDNLPSKNKQLGLFAKKDILPGETILRELSLLAVNNRFKDSLCDACSAEIPPQHNTESTATSCPKCDDITFCSRECHDRAELEYHPAVCGKDVETIGKNLPLKEKTFGLYFLLLCRTLAMASTQNVHPLDLTQIKYIWGDFLPTTNKANSLSSLYDPITFATKTSIDNSARTLPFTFKFNVAEPLHLLEKMDIDIFASLANYDLWVINTLYCKFRGTASARVNRETGHPEVAAVHPLWCLANHDCDPNVQWEWAGGTMHLWSRKTRIANRYGDEKNQRNLGMTIKAGEEILNHYCDIELNVHERREWAKGSLGGLCQCNRCLREEKNE